MVLINLKFLGYFLLEDKTLKTERTQLLFNWLKSVTYWGIAKNTQTKVRKDQAGYNNISFEDVMDDKGVTTTRLFISGKGKSYAFTEMAEILHKVVCVGPTKKRAQNITYNGITLNMFVLVCNRVIS